MTLLSVRRNELTGAPSRALRYLPTSALLLDLAIVATVGLLAITGRRRLPIFENAADVSSNLTVAGPLVVLGWILVIAFMGGYRNDVFGAGTDEYKRVLNASLVTAGLLGVSCYLAKFSLSRGFFLLLFAVGVPSLILGRYSLRRTVHEARRQGKLQYRVAIAGLPSHVDEIAAVLRRESWLGYHVVGALTPAHDLNEVTGSGIPVIGSCEEATSVVKTSDLDIIFFAGGALSSANQLRKIAWDLEQQDVQVVVAPSVTDVSGERVRVRPVGGLPLIHIDPPRATDAARWGKRLFDVVSSTLLLIAFAPLFAIAAARIKVADGGPIFFPQTRIGRNGGEFRCLKFRSMVVDAEARLAALQVAEGYEGGLFKMKDDPRITKPGRWLRRYSLDELPQLWNVLRGEMSLVGPRPPLPLEVATYHTDTRRRLRVRPGMTGLWQVSGRSDLSWSEAIRLDLYYVDNWSMLQDLNILTKTVGAVFSRRGAY
ncbi:Exopolysaccharide biosynthesis polyprenyl glycos ylphosphotransferase [Nocardioides sp. PD653]|nr:Exopolysaccharide biosynthesis polyprenyl glycosylphosphotransferase [Nocardioides sp. PD653-B2]GAW52802.1 Exopolysaccharide biosynthesis polyprenyl glycos ylphosphotransferase [Nocardioides sp. PD653]